ncbi:terminase small subunit [Antarcticirhabdus aurantiaca]|uniref:terminase small subunit n=1 Tax=Antarcticirhabdus aurantiaca TaxID=2606717 RepID=UPI00131A6526|nr:hypothetical protein [Antarcticirhabdus aurantiaca]
MKSRQTPATSSPAKSRTKLANRDEAGSFEQIGDALPDAARGSALRGRAKKPAASLPTEVSTKDFGDLVGISARTVQNLIAEGTIERTASGKIPLAEATAAYCERLRKSAAGRAEAGDLDLTAERARLAKEQADAQEMKNAVGRGELLKAADVQRAWADILRMVQALMLSLSSKVQQKLPHLTAHDIDEIDRVVRRILEEASGGAA